MEEDLTEMREGIQRRPSASNINAPHAVPDERPMTHTAARMAKRRTLHASSDAVSLSTSMSTAPSRHLKRTSTGVSGRPVPPVPTEQPPNRPVWPNRWGEGKKAVMHKGIRDKMDELMRLVEASREQHKKNQSSAYQEARAEVHQLQRKIREFRKLLHQRESDLQSLRDEKDRNESRFKTTLKAEQVRNREITDRCQAKDRQMRRQAEELNTLRQKLADPQDKTHQYTQEQYNELQARLHEAEKAASAASDRSERLEQQCAALQKKNDELCAASGGSESAFSAYRERVREAAVREIEGRCAEVRCVLEQEHSRQLQEAREELRFAKDIIAQDMVQQRDDFQSVLETKVKAHEATQTELDALRELMLRHRSSMDTLQHTFLPQLQQYMDVVRHCSGTLADLGPHASTPRGQRDIAHLFGAADKSGVDLKAVSEALGADARRLTTLVAGVQDKQTKLGEKRARQIEELEYNLAVAQQTIHEIETDHQRTVQAILEEAEGNGDGEVDEEIAGVMAERVAEGSVGSVDEEVVMMQQDDGDLPNRHDDTEFVVGEQSTAEDSVDE